MGVSKKAQGTIFALSEVAVLNKEVDSLLQEKDLSFVVKYDLATLFVSTQAVVTQFEKTRMDIFKKYGKVVKGEEAGYTLDGCKDKDKAVEEINKLLAKTEVFTTKFKLADFKGFKSEKAYFFIYRFFDV